MLCLKSTLNKVGDELARVKLENENLRHSFMEKEQQYLEKEQQYLLAVQSMRGIAQITDRLLQKSSETIGDLFAIEGEIENLLATTPNPEVQSMLKRVLNFVKSKAK